METIKMIETLKLIGRQKELFSYNMGIYCRSKRWT